MFSFAGHLAFDSHLLSRLPLLCNAVVSNVPGPPVALYLGGARLVALHPFGPIIDGVGMNVTVVSSYDTVGVGLVTCPDLTPDVWELLSMFSEEFALTERST
jgi:hypothetical protein